MQDLEVHHDIVSCFKYCRTNKGKQICYTCRIGLLSFQKISFWK